MKKLSIMMVAAILLISALTCTACASDTNYNNIAADIAADLLANGRVEMELGGNDAAALRRSVQEYVDALQVKSETSVVTAKILNPNKADATLILGLDSSGEAEFSQQEIDELLGNCGRNLTTINMYICMNLQYDRDAADDSNLHLRSDAARAKSGLKTGKAVCQGYANLFAILAENSGFEVIKMRGRMSDGVYHVANAVRDDQGNIRIWDVCSNDASENYWADGINLDEYCKKIGFTPSINVETAFELKY